MAPRSYRAVRRLVLGALSTFASVAVAAADITNEATAAGVYAGQSLSSPVARVEIEVSPASPRIRAVSNSKIIDDDGQEGLSPGDSVVLELTVENIGDIAVSELTFETEADQSGRPQPDPSVAAKDQAAAGGLAVGATRTFAVRHELSRMNIESGDDITLRVAVSGTAAGERVLAETFARIALPPLLGIDPSDLAIALTAGEEEVLPGGTVDFAVTAFNRSAVDMNAMLVVEFPEGMEYSATSGEAGAGRLHLRTEAGRLIANNLAVPANSTGEMRFSARVKNDLPPSVLTVRAALLDRRTEIRLIPEADASVRTAPDAEPSCAGVALHVFDDADRDGELDDGEPGIAGVRIAPEIGLPMTTAQDGRYASPCVTASRLGGVDLELKLEAETLPDGYFVTTPNPMRVRVGRGETARMAFGAASAQIVRVDVNAAAFIGETEEPDTSLAEDITRLISVLDRQPSLLRLTYFANRESEELASRRVEKVRDTVLQRWQAAGRRYPLEIDTRVVGKGG
ncbi:hypothetical protein [Oricola cellulosilytica]|uniref:DUF11 domain-containing protein n=1 Tax=Oricola cellulosilytica TaxID=1429082 RepID=A0A4R0PED0_9HYPH|nr:hypothetical protein [Oricola cellulosilytica]TCD14978.1 hypothetical protein E0D97_05345 [Oricola cellulosilytica]